MKIGLPTFKMIVIRKRTLRDYDKPRYCKGYVKQADSTLQNRLLIKKNYGKVT